MGINRSLQGEMKVVEELVYKELGVDKEERKYDLFDVMNYIAKKEEELKMCKEGLEYYANGNHYGVEVIDYEDNKEVDYVIDDGKVARDLLEKLRREVKEE